MMLMLAGVFVLADIWELSSTVAVDVAFVSQIWTFAFGFDR